MPDTAVLVDLHTKKRKDLHKNAKVRNLTLILIKIKQARVYSPSVVHEKSVTFLSILTNFFTK